MPTKSLLCVSEVVALPRRLAPASYQMPRRLPSAVTSMLALTALPVTIESFQSGRSTIRAHAHAPSSFLIWILIASPSATSHLTGTAQSK